MAVDENGNEIIIQPAPEPNRANERITELSEKVKTEATARELAESERDEAKRNAAFAEGFSDIVSNNPAAKDHKEDIRAKVKLGMSVEDAMYAVLGPAGKLQAPVVESRPTAGGSAVITPPQGGAKAIHEMTREERKVAFHEAVNRGDISLN